MNIEIQRKLFEWNLPVQRRILVTGTLCSPILKKCTPPYESSVKKKSSNFIRCFNNIQNDCKTICCYAQLQRTRWNKNAFKFQAQTLNVPMIDRTEVCVFVIRNNCCCSLRSGSIHGYERSSTEYKQNCMREKKKSSNRL